MRKRLGRSTEVHERFTKDADAEPEVYLPYLQSTKELLGASLMVRTSGDASRMAPAIRTLAAEIDRTLPLGAAIGLGRDLWCGRLFVWQGMTAA
jgi:hypothetical protein